MRDLIKYLALGLGGFLIYRQVASPSDPSPQPQPQQGAPDPGAGAGAGTSPPAPANNTQPPAAPPTPPPSAAINLESLIRAAAGKPRASDLLSFDQWNYFYQKVRGVAGPAVEDAFPGMDRAYLMNYEEWQRGVAPFGIS